MDHREVEIKLRVESLDRAAARIRSLGAGLHRKRVFEDNYLLDYRDGRIRRGGSLLRIRLAGAEAFLTYKGPGRIVRRAKSRREIETRLDDGAALLAVLGRLGLRTMFRYQKFRTTYRHGSILIALDETPIGSYLEIEGSPQKIERFARRLGYDPTRFITQTYHQLFVSYKRANHLRSKNMMFGI